MAFTREQYKAWWASEKGTAYKNRKRVDKNMQHKKYRQSEKGKLVARRKAERMRIKFPEKWSARSKLRYAVNTGRVKKIPCIKCGDKISFAHHPDYSKPLEVMWFCRIHHREVHDNKS